MSDETTKVDPAQPAPPAPAAPANADMQALLGLLSEMKSEIDALKQAKAPESKPEPKAVPAGAPEWAGAIIEKLNRLEADKAASDLRSKKQSLSQSVLADVPEPNRGAADLALRGLLADVQLGVDTDVSALAKSLSTQLRSAAPQLYSVPGSRLAAMQQGPDGKLDWSQVRSFDDIPQSLISQTPMEVVARLRAGSQTSGANSAIPLPLFRKSN